MLTGNQIKEIRASLGLSQSKFAQAVGKHPSWSYYAENKGVKDPELVEKVMALKPGEITEIKHYENTEEEAKQQRNAIWKLSCRKFEISGSKESIIYFLKGE